MNAMESPKADRNQGVLDELVTRIRQHPRLRQAILSGLTAAITAELAIVGLAGVVDPVALAQAGQLAVSADAFAAQRTPPITDRLDNTSGGGW